MSTATPSKPAAPAPETGLALQRKQQLAKVRTLLEESKAGLQMALPKHIPADYIMRVVLTSVQRTPELLECHPITLLGAVFQAAQLGLVPDGVLGQAYLVPYRNAKKNRKEVQFIPGYRGLMSLARRSGEVSTISAEVVHAKDVFKYRAGVLTQTGVKVLLDIKTGHLPPTVGLQLSAYRRCLPDPHTYKRMALQLKADGTFALHDLTDRRDDQRFLNALDLWHWKREHLRHGV